MAEQLNWELPDVIIYPTGGGTGLIGMWKAFAEMEQMGWIGSKRPPYGDGASRRLRADCSARLQMGSVLLMSFPMRRRLRPVCECRKRLATF